MKIKIFKKLIAVLCAATMSMAVVAPAGAIRYAGKDKMNHEQQQAFDSLNNNIKKIKNDLNDIHSILKQSRAYHYRGMQAKPTLDNIVIGLIDVFNELNQLEFYNITNVDSLSQSVEKIGERIGSLREVATFLKENTSNQEINNVQKILEDSKKILEDAKNKQNITNLLKKMNDQMDALNINNINNFEQYAYIDNNNNKNNNNKNFMNNNFMNMNMNNNINNNNNNMMMNMNMNMNNNIINNNNMMMNNDNNMMMNMNNNIINNNNMMMNNNNNMMMNNNNNMMMNMNNNIINNNNMMMNNDNNMMMNMNNNIINNNNMMMNNMNMNINNNNNNVDNIGLMIDDEDDETDIQNPIFSMAKTLSLAKNEMEFMKLTLRLHGVKYHGKNINTMRNILNTIDSPSHNHSQLKNININLIKNNKTPLISDLIYLQGDDKETKFNSDTSFNIKTINDMKDDLKLTGDEQTFEQIDNRLSILIVEAGQKLKEKQLKQYGNREKFMKHMSELTTAINPGVQSYFKDKYGKGHGNCWALACQTVGNFFAHTCGQGNIIKNKPEDVAKSKTPNELTTVDKHIDDLLNNGVPSESKINVKTGQSDFESQKLLDKMNIKTLSFEIPDDWKKKFDNLQLRELSLKTQAYLLLEHFLNNDTPVLLLANYGLAYHQTAIIGINTFDGDIMLGDENRVAFPGGLVTIEHPGVIEGINYDVTPYEISSKHLDMSLDPLQLNSYGLNFTFAKNKPAITTTKNCTWNDIKTKVLPIIKENS